MCLATVLAGLLASGTALAADGCQAVVTRSVTRVADLPDYVRAEVTPMADAGARWQATDAVTSHPAGPTHRLVFAGPLQDGDWLVVSEHGGRGYWISLAVYKRMYEAGTRRESAKARFDLRGPDRRSLCDAAEAMIRNGVFVN